MPILYNDAICCSPFEISIVLFNTLFLEYCNVVGNTLVMKTKTGVPDLAGVTLATYRVTCENGMFDEADVTADVNGTVPTCPPPRAVAMGSITSMTADVTWLGSIGISSYNWVLYLASDLGTPVQSGNIGSSPLSLTGLTPSTEYVVTIQSVCDDDTVSTIRSVEFTTLPPEEADICGKYQLTFIDGCGYTANYLDVQYLDCNDTYQSISLFHVGPLVVCMKQTSPGAPVYIEVISYGNNNGPTPCTEPFEFYYTYLEPC